MPSIHHLVPLGAIAAAALAAVPAGAQVAPCTAPPSNASNGSQTFNYSDHSQYFTVPKGVTSLRAEVEGAHGGQEGPTAPGGAAGGVDAVVPVNPGECLTIRTGQFTIGSGALGGGFSRGGSHGTLPGVADTTSGHSAGAGGGSSALMRGVEPLVVAGGGGGGGGDDGVGDGGYGGPGGSGGNTAGSGKRGKDGRVGDGGSGGRGGNRTSLSGGGGADGSGNGGAGGGGGGGLLGGSGGKEGDQIDGGGGGGGAGSSGAPAAEVTPHFFTSGRSCPRTRKLKTCHGAVRLVWSSKPGPIAPETPAIRILSTNMDRLLDEGLPVSHASTGGPLKLELHLTGDGSTKPAVVRTVDSGPGRKRIELEPGGRAKRRLADEDLTRVRLESEHADGNQTQRLRLLR
jgi:hypothetical protein